MYCLTIYISVIRFLYSTNLCIFRLNDVTYFSTGKNSRGFSRVLPGYTRAVKNNVDFCSQMLPGTCIA